MGRKFEEKDTVLQPKGLQMCKRVRTLVLTKTSHGTASCERFLKERKCNREFLALIFVHFLKRHRRALSCAIVCSTHCWTEVHMRSEAIRCSRKDFAQNNFLPRQKMDAKKFTGVHSDVHTCDAQLGLGAIRALWAWASKFTEFLACQIFRLLFDFLLVLGEIGM